MFWGNTKIVYTILIKKTTFYFPERSVHSHFFPFSTYKKLLQMPFFSKCMTAKRNRLFADFNQLSLPLFSRAYAVGSATVLLLSFFTLYPAVVLQMTGSKIRNIAGRTVSTTITLMIAPLERSSQIEPIISTCV